MAASMLTPYGDMVDARWNNGNVLVRVNGGTETAAFALAAESGLALLPFPDGRWCLVYEDGNGAVQRKYSANRGITWG
jgi:hypothetical protein